MELNRSCSKTSSFSVCNGFGKNRSPTYEQHATNRRDSVSKNHRIKSNTAL